MLALARMLEQEGGRTVSSMRDPRNLPMPTEGFFPSNVDFDEPIGALRGSGRWGGWFTEPGRGGMHHLLAGTRVDMPIQTISIMSYPLRS